MKYEVIEKQAERRRINDLAFRIGIIMAIFGLLIINLGEMFIYEGSVLLFYLPAIVPLYIGFSLFIVGFVFVVITTATFNKDYETNLSD